MANYGSMGALESLSDSELADRLVLRDIAAVEEVYLRYWGLLYQHARKMLRDDAVAEDIVHDIFVQLLDNLGRLNINTSLSSYLYRSVRNRVIDYMDKNSNRQKYINSIKAFYERGEYITDEQIRENEMKKQIEDAIATFPPRMREVFLMSRTGELSRKEIAEATHVSEETIKTQIKRALKILRSKLTALFV